MVTKKKKVEEHVDGLDIPLATDAKAFRTKAKSKWPKVTVGSHSTRTEYEDGRVEFVTDWALLERDVKQALEDYEKSLNVTPKKTKKAKIK